MAVHPIEGRYKTEEIAQIFSEENIIKQRLRIEAALAHAHSEVGNIPRKAARIIEKCVNEDLVTPEKVKKQEEKTDHDLMALVYALVDECNKKGDVETDYIHMGATSNDIIDTTWAIILRDSLDIIIRDARKFLESLLETAEKEKKTLMVGRTHGQHATPMTFGASIVVYAKEMKRNIKRLMKAQKRISHGKMKGAVGTGAPFGKHARKIEDETMKYLDLKRDSATTQVISRDRHAEVVFALAQLVQTLDNMALNYILMAQTDVGEIGVNPEKIKKKTGSSTMPQKVNPWEWENIRGIARHMRSKVQIALENQALMYQRDMSNSSAERMMFPETFMLAHFSLKRMTKLTDGLLYGRLKFRYDIKKMRENLEKTGGAVMAEAVMMHLIGKGWGKKDAYKILKKCSMDAYKRGVNLEVTLKEKKTELRMSGKEIEGIVRHPEKYIGDSIQITEENIEKCRKFLEKDAEKFGG